MSDAHASHRHAPDHVPHVTPLTIYVRTFATLLVLTVITVAASRVNLGTTVNLGLALVIATIKASIVAAFFMHLAGDHKFHTVIFVSSVVFLVIFIAFTMFDTEARGRAEAIEKTRPVNPKDPFALPDTITTVTAAAAPAPAAPPKSSASAAPPASPSAEPSASAATSASAAPASSADAPPAPSASAGAAPSASAAPAAP
ncbi:MAG: cytochrome C oxidase subunit IV family protein [Myxococcales bacterium]|nr:cytochrome C oxidase subunit IV family protein [Myxococcales bacterium]